MLGYPHTGSVPNDPGQKGDPSLKEDYAPMGLVSNTKVVRDCFIKDLLVLIMYETDTESASYEQMLGKDKQLDQTILVPVLPEHNLIPRVR